MKRRDPFRFIPCHEGAHATLTVGIFFGLAFAISEIPCPWIGFFIGAVPTAMLFAWGMVIEEDLAANHDLEEDSDDA